jgi:hypothetical protein
MGTVEPTITVRLGLSRAAAPGSEVTSDRTSTLVETDRTPRSTSSTTKSGNTQSS